MDRVTLQLIEKYENLTRTALKMVKNASWDKNRLAEGKDFVLMCESYLKDSVYFKEKGELVLAYGALNYSHAWLDAGARIGIFSVHDSKLFTVDDLH